jgi:hypothetical protein
VTVPFIRVGHMSWFSSSALLCLCSFIQRFFPLHQKCIKQATAIKPLGDCSSPLTEEDLHDLSFLVLFILLMILGVPVGVSMGITALAPPPAPCGLRPDSSGYLIPENGGGEQPLPPSPLLCLACRKAL